MNITFMIGNGFDLACGLKTRYTDVYKKYCVSQSSNETLQDFKQDILGTGNYENWTDFEMALPEFGKSINDFDKFEMCVLDFVDFLNDYLLEQQQTLDIDRDKVTLAKKMKNFIYHFYNYCLQSSKISLQTKITNGTTHSVYNFITFNYTDTLEKLLSCMPSAIPKHRNGPNYLYQMPVHIHSTLGKDILVGLDNEILYRDIPCADSRKLKNLIDKVHINSRYSSITAQAVKLLEESNIIVILGWSMGDSDSYWVNTIKKLFGKSKVLNIVYVPYYNESLNARQRRLQLNREDESKDFIAKKFEIPDSELSRVHIVTASEYMQLPKIVRTEESFAPVSDAASKEVVDIM